MKELDYVFYNVDFREFRDWIRLDINALTWQGRYLKEFEEFWSVFFLDGLSFKQVLTRFSYAISIKQIGPISSWFHWLRNKFIIYVFINRKIGIDELAQMSNLRVNEIAYVLRDFFACKFPEFENELNQIFQIGNVASLNYKLTFDQLCKFVDVSNLEDGLVPNDVMQFMEITLYKEWEIFQLRLKKDLLNKSFKLELILKKSSLKKAFKFIIEIVVLTIIGLSLVYLIKVMNVWYESYLVERISVNEPTLTWLDGSLRFKAADEKVDLAKIKAQSLENIVQENPVTKDIDRVQIQDNTDFGTESEISLTSWDVLPKDFSYADEEKSEYEETDQFGTRDTQYGNRKVFRVIMNTTSSDVAQKKLNGLLTQYNVTQVDNVKPGQKVPGGMYYNIYVPRIKLKEFMAKVEEVDDTMVYETRTRGTNPPNQNRVFIWIKQI